MTKGVEYIYIMYIDISPGLTQIYDCQGRSFHSLPCLGGSFQSSADSIRGSEDHC